VLTTKRHFTLALWMPVRLSATTPAFLNRCGRGPWWDVLRRALDLMEDILSTCYKCTLTAVTHKLHVHGHMLIWTFFSCFGLWNSCQKYFLIFQLHFVYHLKSEWNKLGKIKSNFPSCKCWMLRDQTPYTAGRIARYATAPTSLVNITSESSCHMCDYFFCTPTSPVLPVWRGVGAVLLVKFTGTGTVQSV
jgi:hypothetical protein